MKIKKLCILACLISLLATGCSRLYFYNGYKQSRPVSWKILPDEEDRVFAYECDCDSFSLKMRTLDAGSWTMIGPPLVPLLPFGAFSRSHSSAFYFDVEVIPRKDSVLIRFPKLAMRIDSREELVGPADSFLVQRKFDRITEEGLYHWDFRVGSLNYMYKFNLQQYPDTFTVVFSNPYLHCEIPPITYVARSQVVYRPLLYAGPRTTTSPPSGGLQGWSGGILAGVVHTPLTQQAGSLFRTNVGFNVGFQVGYDDFFFRLEGSAATGRVRKPFDRNGSWRSGLPLNVAQGFWALGYHFRVSERSFLKPMVALSDLDLYNQGGGTRLQTNITHGGLGLGMLYSPPTFLLFNGVELDVSVGWPIVASQRSQFPGAMWRLSLGLLFLPDFGPD